MRPHRGKQAVKPLPSSAQTVLDALLTSLEKAAAYNRNTQVAPAVILWPDHG